jgi:uncharacterized protein YacL
LNVLLKRYEWLLFAVLVAVLLLDVLDVIALPATIQMIVSAAIIVLAAFGAIMRSGKKESSNGRP